MGRDKMTEFIVVRLGAVMNVDCKDSPGKPTLYGYNDACRRMLSLKGEFPHSAWAVLPVANWLDPDA
jgi:hypothetical protein